MSAALLCALSSAHADFAPERKYEEVLDPPTPVSGHAIVGVLVLPSRQAQQSDTLWVRAGGIAQAMRIRVDVASANGRLHGEGTWTFKPEPASAPQWFALAVPPRAKRPDRAEHLAVAVQPAIDPPGSVPAFLLAAWGPSAPEAAAQIRLYVNARRAEMFAYPPEGTKPVRCVPLEDTATVRFDVICDLELKIGPSPGTARLTLVRRDGSSTSRQPLELRW